MTKKELIRLKQHYARQIRNIRIDYSGVADEDMPDEILDEITILITRMNEIRVEFDDRYPKYNIVLK